jgi:ADP-L-glycero-D-manno-heptose 6-epimerase
VYVRDAVRVILFFLDRPDVSGLFNCGTGRGRTWLDLARSVFAAVDREPRIRFIDMPETLRAVYQYCTVADTGKLRAAGYEDSFTPLEDGVREYVQSYLV